MTRDSDKIGPARDTPFVKRRTKDGSWKRNLSNTIVVPNLLTSLLSILSLVKKNIAARFLPDNAIMIDLADEFPVLGYD